MGHGDARTRELWNAGTQKRWDLGMWDIGTQGRDKQTPPDFFAEVAIKSTIFGALRKVLYAGEFCLPILP